MADTYPTTRLATRSVDARSVGFLIAGASTVAGTKMIPAIRQQPPAPASRDVAGAWIVGVHSHNERRARDFADRHGIVHCSSDLTELLQRHTVHCVYVGNHPRRHAETVAAALAAHKHVLCETPLALHPAEAATLQRMAEQRGLVLAMNYTWRAGAALRRLHDLLAEDVIGELLGGEIRHSSPLRHEQHTWRLEREGGGALLVRTLLSADVVQFLLHRSVRTVAALTGTPLRAGQVEEEIFGHFGCTGGLVVRFHDSFLLPHVPPLLELYGATGTLRLQHWPVETGVAALTILRRDEEERVAIELVDPYRAAVARFLAAIRGAAPPLATAADDQRNLLIVEACRTSLSHSGALTTVPQMI
jgi:1,5-anhydro-D-fructose reductase (1,5-anhydro-D-mannitol-forming)